MISGMIAQLDIRNSMDELDNRFKDMNFLSNIRYLVL